MSKPMADTSKRRSRRQFTDEFKASAVRLVLDEGKTVGAAARDLDLTETALREWVRRAQADRSKGRTGLTLAEREELARLRKEVRELRTEREILKKWSCARPHPRPHESGSVSVASEPGQGRRLLVPRARKKMDPSAAPQAPRTVARLPPGIAEHAR
jgi:transposase